MQSTAVTTGFTKFGLESCCPGKILAISVPVKAGFSLSEGLANGYGIRQHMHRRCKAGPSGEAMGAGETSLPVLVAKNGERLKEYGGLQEGDQMQLDLYALPM